MTTEQKEKLKKEFQENFVQYDYIKGFRNKYALMKNTPDKMWDFIEDVILKSESSCLEELDDFIIHYPYVDDWKDSEEKIIRFLKNYAIDTEDLLKFLKEKESNKLR